MKTKKLIPILIVISAIGCGNNKPDSDAFGHFESREVVVSAERAGTLQEFSISEGDLVDVNIQVGLIDTTSLDNQRQQLLAQIEALKAKRSTARAQTAVIEEELKTLDTEVLRFEALVTNEAVPSKQLDDLRSKKRVLTKQVDLQKTQERYIQAEIVAMSTQLLNIDDQIDKSKITNPISGRVLHTHVERFEMTSPGKPLYTIANLDTLDLRIYVTGDQLSSIQLGKDVEVIYDAGNKTTASTSGSITRIASEAEFTPKFLQTREERVSLVYAVIVRVPNNGTLQIGMPAEVRFKEE